MENEISGHERLPSVSLTTLGVVRGRQDRL